MTALVTGGPSGIGLEFCRALAKRGADIVMVSIQEKELAESCRALSETYGVKTHHLLLDLSGTTHRRKRLPSSTGKDSK